MTLVILFLILALACFVTSAAGASANVNLQSLGLAFWVIAQLLPLFGR